MKKFKTILIVTLILDILQTIPLIMVKMGGEMKDEMIASMGIDGLSDSAPGIFLLETMMFVFTFIMVGTLVSIFYTLRLKNVESLKTASFLLFISHLFWTMPDFINLASGSPSHPPILFMVISLIPVIGLFYVSRKGEL